MLAKSRGAPVNLPVPGLIPDTITGPGGGPMTSGTPIALPERTLPSADPRLRPPYTCPKCGHCLSVSGLGRHRVYLELDDKRSDHPVMNRVCPKCGHCLPGKNSR